VTAPSKLGGEIRWIYRDKRVLRGDVGLANHMASAANQSLSFLEKNNETLDQTLAFLRNNLQTERNRSYGT
jgi:hypothetical protein